VLAARRVGVAETHVMDARLDMTFHRLPYDETVEPVVERWIARVAALGVAVDTVNLLVEPLARRQKRAHVVLTLDTGASVAAIGIANNLAAAITAALRTAHGKCVITA